MIRWAAVFFGVSVPLMAIGVLLIQNTVAQYIVGAVIGISAVVIADRDFDRCQTRTARRAITEPGSTRGP